MKKTIQITFKRLNHVQLCIPKNKETEAREFYIDLLGLEEIDKPESLKMNGGFWLRIADIELHIGAEDFENKSKRHPAFEVENLGSVKESLIRNGVVVKEYDSLPAFHRFSFYDPFNNRIELLEKKTLK